MSTLELNDLSECVTINQVCQIRRSTSLHCGSQKFACMEPSAHAMQNIGERSTKLTNVVGKSHVVENGVVAVCYVEGATLVCD